MSGLGVIEHSCPFDVIWPKSLEAPTIASKGFLPLVVAQVKYLLNLLSQRVSRNGKLLDGASNLSTLIALEPFPFHITAQKTSPTDWWSTAYCIH